jgi:beta-phosphoglucomutase family hydrolase
VAGTLDPARFDAILFDLDGVLTETASQHARAWKQTFDEVLRQRATDEGTPFVPFDIDKDYTEYVDGKPRFDGVRSFLQSRSIDLPEGTTDEPAGTGSVSAIGKLKNERVNELWRTEGVEAYPGSVKLLRQVRAKGMKTAIVSSSKNCLAVIEAAGIADQFDARVDGNVTESGELAGKPAPDTYLEAARELATPPARAVVFEDALAGVESGRAGHFGLVVGVDRNDDAEALRQHGADIVVQDLAELLDPA